jgi:hypothetical protein
MNPKRLLGLLLALLALGLAGACGKKEAPLAPEAVLPGTVKNFASYPGRGEPGGALGLSPGKPVGPAPYPTRGLPPVSPAPSPGQRPPPAAPLILSFWPISISPIPRSAGCRENGWFTRTGI